MAHEEPTFSLGYTIRASTHLFLPRPLPFTEPHHPVIERILEALAPNAPPLPPNGEMRFAANLSAKLQMTWRNKDSSEFTGMMEYLVIRGAIDLRIANETLANYPYDASVNELCNRIPLPTILDCLADPDRIRVIPFEPGGQMSSFAVFQKDGEVTLIVLSGFPNTMPLFAWANRELHQRFSEKLAAMVSTASAGDA